MENRACNPHLIKDQIAFHKIASCKTIIPIDPSTRTVVAQVISDYIISTSTLKVAARLLPIHSKFMDVVIGEKVSVWVRFFYAKNAIG